MEIEAKFLAPDAEVLHGLEASTHLGGLPLGEAWTEDVTDLYVDTVSRQLLASSFFCRLRLSGERVVATLKQTGAAGGTVHRREEYEVELPEYAAPDLWPDSPARTKVLELTQGAPLVDMLELRQTRTKRLVGDADHPTAELSLDVVQLKTGRQPDNQNEKVYFEVELELKENGSEDDLAALVAELQSMGPLVPEPRSKFERALAAMEEAQPGAYAPSPVGAEAADEVGGAEQPTKRKGKGRRTEMFLGDGLEVLEKPDLKADDTMSEAARKTLLFHLQRMMLHEPGTREGEDPEELHDMRVATRRMRAAVRVFEDYLDMKEFKPFIQGMRQTGRELGAVRDLDVFRIKTQAYIDALPVEEQSGLDPLLEAWSAERARARAELLRYLDGGGYQRFKEKFEAFLREPGAGAGRTTGADGEPLPTRVGDVLPGVLFDRLALVKAYDQPISRPDAPLAVFHQLRITSKGLRYTLEFFQEVLGPAGKPLIDRTKRVQDHLGDLQDAVVTCDVLLNFLGTGTWGPPPPDKKGVRTLFPVNAPGVATYLAVKQGEIERLMHTFDAPWSQIRGSEFSQPLAALVASL